MQKEMNFIEEETNKIIKINYKINKMAQLINSKTINKIYCNKIINKKR